MRLRLAVLILLLPNIGFAQAPRAAKKPLDQVQVLALLAGGVANQRVAMLVEEPGITFDPNDRYLNSLKAAGAEEVLLKALLAARRLKPPGGRLAAGGRSDPIQQHLARGAELARQKSRAAAEEEYRAARKPSPRGAWPCAPGKFNCGIMGVLKSCRRGRLGLPGNPTA